MPDGLTLNPFLTTVLVVYVRKLARNWLNKSEAVTHEQYLKKKIADEIMTIHKKTLSMRAFFSKFPELKHN